MDTLAPGSTSAVAAIAGGPIVQLQSTAALLALLEYEERDLKTRVSSIAHPEHVVSSIGKKEDGSCDRVLRVEEKLRLDQFVRECNIDRLLYNSDTDFREGQFAPPTGYAATFHEDTTFSPEVMEQSFRVFVSCSVDKEGRFRDDEIQRWKSALNATIPDRSPVPPIYGKHKVKDAWVPSLGSMSWIGIGDCIHSIKGPQPRCVYVVCTLDRATLENLSKQHYQLRNGSYLDAMPVIQWCRDIVRENARRLLYMAVTYMRLQTKAEVHLLCDSLYPKRKATELEKRWFASCGVPDISEIYAGVSPPSGCAVKDCPPVPVLSPRPSTPPPSPKPGGDEQVSNPDEDANDCLRQLFGGNDDDDDDDGDDDDGDEPGGPGYFDRYPRSLVPDVEVFVSDLVAYPHTPKHLLRLSNSCILQNKVVRLSGPDEDVHIYEVRRTDPSEALQTSIWLHSFPASANARPSPSPDAIRKPYLDTTWLDPEQHSSPYLTEWAFGSIDVALHGVDLSRGVITIQPQLVRITCNPPGS